MTDTLRTFDVDGLTVEIELDFDPESPREWDNNGIMLCFHRRYGLGDKTDLQSSDFENWQEVAEYLEREEKAICIMPLYLYDHSGLRIKVGSFSGILPQGHAEFDSGQVGFIYTTLEQLNKGGHNFTENITPEQMNQVQKWLEGEVETYDQYLSGQVYGYCIKNEEGEILDSCYGFYEYDYCVQEAKRQAEYLADNRINRMSIDQLQLAF
jgi:hypothetical protein